MRGCDGRGAEREVLQARAQAGSYEEPAGRKPKTALERFASKCRFEPETGCVVWTGGTTSGQGCNTRYGAFWFEGRRWFAHRWSAVYIHGFDLGTDTAGHYCPHTPDGNPNSLCIEHVRPQSMADNVAERNVRYHATRRAQKAQQNSNQRLYWKLVHLGYEEPPPSSDGLLPVAHPRFDPPEWYRPFMPKDFWNHWLEDNYGKPEEAIGCNPLQRPIPIIASISQDQDWALPDIRRHRAVAASANGQIEARRA
jgi:hypothetical protein